MRRMITVNLQRGSLYRVHQGQGRVVTARAGAVWITEQDNLRDIVLRPGESFTLGRGGVALIEAMSDASIGIAPHIPGTHAAVEKVPFEQITAQAASSRELP